MDSKQDAMWIIDVERRLITLMAFKKRKILHSSVIANEVERSVQNISHALHEMEEKGLVESTCEKNSWHKYVLTENGEKTLKEVEKILKKGL